MAVHRLITPGRLVGAGAFVSTSTIAFNRAGYYPTAWGWIALPAALLACVLLARGRVGLSRLELVSLGALVTLTGLVALSSLWGTSSRAIIEAQRAAMYVLVFVALLAAVRRSTVEPLLVGVWAGMTLAAGYGLLTRLLPERLGVLDPVARTRLSEPLGYWNGLGVFAAIGILFACGLVARSLSATTRSLAAASVPILATTLYFTYSRGAWLALAIGGLAWVLVDRRRLQALATVAPVLVLAGVGPAAAYRSDDLNRVGAPLADMAADGRSVAALVWASAVLCAAAGLAIARVEPRWAPRPVVRRAFAVGLIVVALAALTVVFAREGMPYTLVSRAYHGFADPPPAVGADISDRLFSFSGSGRVAQWRVALRDFRREPVAGRGGGSYELAWNERRPYAAKVRDAHSLYLETLSELGVVGLALVLLVFGAPLLAVPRARSTSIAPAAFGAYAAFLVHAGVDWDWEMPSVTLAGLCAATALLVAARGAELRRISGTDRALALVAVSSLTVFALVGLTGNRAVADADHALRDGDIARASARAADAVRWAPWSATARRLEAEASLARGDLENAREGLRRARDADPRNWELWFALAQVTSGREATEALARARRLNPRSPELSAFARSDGS